jgi:hypothetical protein
MTVSPAVQLRVDFSPRKPPLVLITLGDKLCGRVWGKGPKYRTIIHSKIDFFEQHMIFGLKEI